MLILIEVFENSVYLDKLAEDIGGRPYGDVDRNAPAWWYTEAWWCLQEEKDI